MKKIIITAIIALIVNNLFAQVKFSAELSKALLALNVNLTPFAYDELYNSYDNYSADLPVDYQGAIKHKKVNMAVFFNAEPGRTVNMDARIEKLNSDFSCSDLKILDIPEYKKFVRCSDIRIAMAKNSGNSPDGFDMCMFITMLNGNKELLEYYVFFDNTEETMDAFYEFLMLFRFGMQNRPMSGYSGIGVDFRYSTSKKGYEILSVYENFPAHDAGILPGDIIYTIDDEKLTYDDEDGVWEKLEGDEGSKVKVKVFRYGMYINFEMERKEIQNIEDVVFLNGGDIDVYGKSLSYMVYILAIKVVQSPEELKVDKLESDNPDHEIWTTYFILPRDNKGKLNILNISGLGDMVWVEYDMFTGSEEQMKEKYQYLLELFDAYLTDKGFTSKGERTISGDSAEVTYSNEEMPFVYGKIKIEYNYKGEMIFGGHEYEIGLRVSN